MIPLKQSRAFTMSFFAHDENGDAVTGLANGDWTKRIKKHGGSWGAMTVTITEEENGWYELPISAAHSDTAGMLTMTFTAAGAKQVNLLFRVSGTLVDDIYNKVRISWG